MVWGIDAGKRITGRAQLFLHCSVYVYTKGWTWSCEQAGWQRVTTAYNGSSCLSSAELFHNRSVTHSACPCTHPPLQLWHRQGLALISQSICGCVWLAVVTAIGAWCLLQGKKSSVVAYVIKIFLVLL